MSHNSINRRIFTAIITIGGFTLLVKIATFFKDVLIAHRFGTGDDLDAFLIAILLPLFVINVIAGSFSAALIPTYIQVREMEGVNSAQRLFSNIVTLSILILIVVCAFLAVAGQYLLPVLGNGFSTDKLLLTRSLFLIFIPIPLINGLSIIWGTVLNAVEYFMVAAIIPIATPIVIVLFLIFFNNSLGIYSLALGTLGGFTLEAVFLAWNLKRKGFSIIPRWYGIDITTKQVLNQYIPMVAGAFLMSSTQLVDHSMATMLGPGNVSILNYGNKLVSFVNGLGAMTLGTAVLPFFSRAVVVGDWNSIQHSIKTYTRIVLILTVPLVLIVILLSEPIVHLLFERGAFTELDTNIVSRVQVYYFLQLPFYFIGILFVRFISSLKANKLLMYGAVLNLIINIVLNYFFMHFMGVSGIALSTTVVYIFSFIYLLYSLSLLVKEVS